MSYRRRDVLTWIGAAAAHGVAGCASSTPSEASLGQSASSDRMPAVYLPHGGGPWPWMDASAFGPADMYDGMRTYLKSLGALPATRPKALLVISAHWEETVPTVMASAKPPMYYDYSGFPPETYEVNWPAPGAPEVAQRVRELLEATGQGSAENGERGFDHGTFVPLALSHPDADVATFQLSLKRGLDPATHIAIGRALAPLRDEGVFLIGSGMSYHNMYGFFGRVPTAAEDARVFDEWLAETIASEPSLREQRLVEWQQAPRARLCHPREEHLLPVHVIAGAAENDEGTTPYRDKVMGASVLAAHFG